MITVHQEQKEETTGFLSPKKVTRVWTAIAELNRSRVGSPAPSLKGLLDPMGAAGWELVAVVSEGTYASGGQLLYFKRLVPAGAHPKEAPDATESPPASLIPLARSDIRPRPGRRRRPTR